MNGSRGVVKSFAEGGLPIVLFENRMQKEVSPSLWTRGSERQVNASREQVPLRLACALTLHRCQVFLFLSSLKNENAEWNQC